MKLEKIDQFKLERIDQFKLEKVADLRVSKDFNIQSSGTFKRTSHLRLIKTQINKFTKKIAQFAAVPSHLQLTMKLSLSSMRG